MLRGPPREAVTKQMSRNLSHESMVYGRGISLRQHVWHLGLHTAETITLEARHG